MHLKGKQGYTLAEVMVVTLMLSIVLIAGSLLFMAGQSAWTNTDVEIQLVEDLRMLLSRALAELQESGTDKNGTFQVTFLDNTGVNGSDVLRFSVPICVCGTSVIDENGDVKNWGAPLAWGDAGCSSDYLVGNNGKVDICHLVPGNPGSENNLSVSVNSVKAHLARGDRLGDCNSCDPDTYTNKTIEYLVDGNGRLLRNVLDGNGAVIGSSIFANNLSDFQISLNGGQSIVTLSVQLSKSTAMSRVITKNADIDVVLRN